MERLFTVISRINSVLLLVALIGICIFMGWASWSSGRWQQRGTIEVADAGAKSNSPIFLSLERVENIKGADTQMMLLSAREKSGKLTSGSGYASETRNVLFLTGTEKKARWLFPKQSNVILVAAQLREQSNDLKEAPAKALYFEFVTEDTDGDGKLSSQDRSNVALSKPDGTAFIQVLSGVDRVLSYEMLNDKQLSVVYQVGKIVRHARFSASSLTKEIDQEIVNVPDKL